jgi:hypothetical protein
MLFIMMAIIILNATLHVELWARLTRFAAPSRRLPTVSFAALRCAAMTLYHVRMAR